MPTSSTISTLVKNVSQQIFLPSLLREEDEEEEEKKKHITTSDLAIDLYHRHFDIRFEVLRIEKKYKKKRGTRFESEKGESRSLKEIRTKEIGSFSANILPSQSSSEQPLQQT